MKIPAVFVALVISLLLGCVHEQPNFAGRTPSGPRAEAETIWKEQLAKGSTGIKNRAVVRALRGYDRDQILVLTNAASGWKAPKVGMPIGEGGSIKLGPGASSDLFLGDNGPVLRALENTTVSFVRLNLRIRETERVADTMIDLEEGQIQGAVKKMAAESSYLIRTRAGVIQVRGTEFRATAEGTLAVITGSAVIFTKGKEVVVHEGQEYFPATGELRKSTFEERPLPLWN